MISKIIKKKPVFLKNITEHKLEFDESVTIEHLEDFISAVRVRTGLSQEAAEKVVQSYFQEMRNQLILNNKFAITGIGKIYLRAGQKSNWVKISQTASITKKIND
jgi:nucleoid DNA-binding protein